jgi:peptidylprolyl isomerase
MAAFGKFLTVVVGVGILVLGIWWAGFKYGFITFNSQNDEAAKQAAAAVAQLPGAPVAPQVDQGSQQQVDGGQHVTIAQTSEAQAPDAPAAPSQTPPQAQDVQKVMNATIHTSKGDISIEFFDKDAPNTVANFIKLAKSGFYDGTKFHRVIKGFMIQGGDPLTKDDSMQARWGTGGPGYQFADEIRANNHNDVGTIAMANAGPNTNGSQFFINVAANNFLDGKHTTFGKVTAGMDVVNAIENVTTSENDRPLEPVVVNSVTLQ